MELDAQGLGHAQPDLISGPDRGHFGPADAGRKGAVRAVGRGMRIAAHDDLAGQGEAVLGKNLVADAVLDVEEVGNSLGPDELADGLMVLGIFLVRRGHDMVKDDDDLFGRFDLGQAKFFELADDGRGVVVREVIIRNGGDDLAGPNRPPRLPAQDFFRKCLRHQSSLKKGSGLNIQHSFISYSF